MSDCSRPTCVHTDDELCNAHTHTHTHMHASTTPTTTSVANSTQLNSTRKIDFYSNLNSLEVFIPLVYSSTHKLSSSSNLNLNSLNSSNRLVLLSLGCHPPLGPNSNDGHSRHQRHVGWRGELPRERSRGGLDRHAHDDGDGGADQVVVAVWPRRAAPLQPDVHLHPVVCWYW